MKHDVQSRARTAKTRELNLKLPAAQRSAESTRFRAQAAKADLKGARKTYKEAKKLAKEARKKLKALKKALRQIAEGGHDAPVTRVTPRKAAAKKSSRRKTTQKPKRPAKVRVSPASEPAIVEAALTPADPVPEPAATETITEATPPAPQADSPAEPSTS